MKRALRPGFVRNAMVLAGGAAGAQAVSALVAPLLTRLYVPAEIGQLGLLMSFIGLSVVTLSLRYEQAIVLPDTAAAAARVLALALTLVPVISLVAAAVLGLLIATDIADFGSLPVIAVPIAFVGLLGFGAMSALRYWHIRERAFRQVSQVQVVQSLVRSIGQVIAGLAGLGVGGLFGVDAVARWSGMVGLARGAQVTARPAWRTPGPSLGATARRYWRFPAFGVPSSFINAAGQALIVPLLAGAYGLEVAGFMALVQRVLGVPLAVIGASVGDALLLELSEHARVAPSRAMPLFRRTALGLAAAGVPLAVVLVLVGPQLFAILFGSAWRDAGTVAAIVSPWLVASLIVSPLSRVAVVYEGQARKLIYDVLNVLAVVVGILGGHAAGLGSFEAIALATGLQVVAYGVYFIILVGMIRDGRIVRPVTPDAGP